MDTSDERSAFSEDVVPRIGARVRVANGLFQGLVGHVERHLRSTRQVAIRPESGADGVTIVIPVACLKRDSA